VDRETAPAKLTLSLRITGVRADGYHVLDAEMVTIDWADELAFTEGDDLVVEGDRSIVAGVPIDGTNLVRRALRAAGRTARVVLTKRVPPGAGLGGGSADAAAVLRWAGCTDPGVAAALGADVPFCVAGGHARVTGVGEHVEPLPPLDATFTLLTPPLHCATAEVYAAWDAMAGPHADGPNDLEPAALRVEPRLAEWRDRLARATGQAPVLAGSGCTWFVPGAFPDVAGARVVRTFRGG
jgi:4-diphosphocytidyl-2-C-methyl-D-erythritol kinase